MPSKYGIDLTESAYGKNIQHKSFSIPHVGSFLNSSDNKKYEGWIVHSGNLTDFRATENFLLAIKEASILSPDKIKGLICVGNISEDFICLIDKLKMNKIVKLLGYKSSKEANEIASNCSILAVIEANMEISPFLPSKFADYALMKKPILAITPRKSQIRDYINKYGSGVSVINDKKEIKRGLQKIISNQLEGIQKNKLSYIFNEKSISDKYREMMNFIISNNEK